MLGWEVVERQQRITVLGQAIGSLLVFDLVGFDKGFQLPAYGQPRLRRDHLPPLSNREMAGCPARKSHSTCSCPIFRCRSSITFCASSTAGALLPRANSSPARVTSSCFQLLIIVG